MLAVSDLGRNRVRGVSQPRIAPPEPAHGRLAEYEAAAAKLKIHLMAHQRIAARYITALTPRPPGRPTLPTPPYADAVASRWYFTTATCSSSAC